MCHFRQEKGQTEALDPQRFNEWLEYHRHEEIKNLIVNAAALRTEVDILLRSDQVEMFLKLNKIGEMLIKLLSRVEEFRPLALAMAPNAGISENCRCEVCYGVRMDRYHRQGNLRELESTKINGAMLVSIGIQLSNFVEAWIA